MAIKDLQAKQGNVNLMATVVSVEPPREFLKFGKSGKVANAIIKDDTGEVKLTLWNEQAEMLKPGDHIEIKNGYVSEWQGTLQLSTGKFGSLAVVDASAVASSDDSASSDSSSKSPSAPKSPSSSPSLATAARKDSPVQKKQVDDSDFKYEEEDLEDEDEY